MKKEIKISVQSDFVSKVFNNYLKNLTDKNFKTRLKVNNQDNINININNNLAKNNDVVIFATHIEKTFINFNQIINSNRSNLKLLDKEIKTISNKIIHFSSFNKHIIFFLWPLDINDSYFGPLNFRKNGKNWLINYINLKFSSELSYEENVNIIDPNYTLLKLKNRFDIFDLKTKYLVNNNYSIEYLEHLANYANANIERIYNKDKVKLIIIDLDNTIWGGEAGERSWDKLEIGPNSVAGQVFLEFQNRLKLLKDNGILLAVCSKNDLNNVHKVFKKNKYMKLKLTDFSSIKVNWKSKNLNIKEILNELNLRSENTLFIDDNKYEREIVKADHNKIQIFDFPNNLLNLNNIINNYKGFEKNYISKTDKKRSKFYLEEGLRNRKRSSFFNESEWIKSLKIKISISKLKNFQRAEEMFSRTNQFNTSHKLLNKTDILKLSKEKGSFIYQISMNDKFGDYGIISIVCIKHTIKSFHIYHFLQSCRVFKRNVEQVVLNFILNEKTFKNKQGYILIKRNEKNKYVQNLFDKSAYLTKKGSSLYKVSKNFKFDYIKKLGIKIIKV